jgi:hypothetical protein
MKLLLSRKFKLPDVFFVSEKSDIKKIPIGVPFIFGNANLEGHLIRLLEYEILFKEAVATGYPFNFKDILRKNGYTKLYSFEYDNPAYIEFKSTDKTRSDDFDIEESSIVSSSSSKFQEFVRDTSCVVNIEILKNLNVFPTWLDDIEKAISTNIHNFATFNNNLYNKKLEGMYGGIDLTSPDKNIIIIDISGSIPRAASTTCLALAKNLAESFYADLLITGSKSTLYAYEEMYKLDVQLVYDQNGMDNDQVYFRKIVSADNRKYKTAIVFGDNHSPCQAWGNAYNQGTKTISRKDGKEICKWDIEKLISFHTSSGPNSEEKNLEIAGYADWFEPKETKHIKGWLKYLK